MSSLTLSFVLATAWVGVDEPSHETWNKALRPTFKDLACVVVDVNQRIKPPTFDTKRCSLDWKPVFGSLMSRAYERVGEAHVFHRNGGIEGSDHLDDKGFWLTNWLVSAPPDLLRKLNSRSMTLGDIPEHQRSEFLSKFLIDPSQNEILLRKGGNTRLKLRVTTGFDYIDPKSGVRRTQTFPIVEPPEPDEVPDAPPAKPQAPEPPPREGVLPLEFLEGETLQVRDIILKADRAFAAQYDYDGRFADDLVFIKGAFDKKRFESIMERVLRGRTFKAGDRRLDDSEKLLLANLATIENAGKTLGLSGYPGDANDVRQGKTVDASSLIQKSEWFAEFAQKAGISPDAKLRLRPALSFYLDPGGETLLSSGKSSRGQEVKIFIKNGIVLTIP